MEKNNISVRAEFWQELVNNCTNSICKRIFSVTSPSQRKKFEYEISENIYDH